ncbi:MAG: hypothetical protein EZS28_032807, partial [Streblomastix strix]
MLNIIQSNFSHRATIADTAKKDLPLVRDAECESKLGLIKAVSGPVSNKNQMFAIDSARVRVGSSELVGEIIRLDGDTATIQVYEET